MEVAGVKSEDWSVKTAYFRSQGGGMIQQSRKFCSMLYLARALAESSVYQPHVSLIDQDDRLQGVAGAFAPQVL